MTVVGAGLAGLAAALHLAGRGREVTVIERDDPRRPGRAPGPGRIPHRHRPHRADHAGPGGRDPGRGGRGADRLARPGPPGPRLPSRLRRRQLARRAYRRRGHDRRGGRFRRPAEAAGYQRLRAWLTELYQREFRQFIAANVDSPLSLVTPSLARLAALGAFRRLDPAIGRFIRDERLRRVFSFQSLYAGESPARALAVYAVIAYMDTVAGVYFPNGGMRALPDALAGAAAKAGVTFHYGQAVTALERPGGRVTAVRTATGLRVPCDAAVLATELTTAYQLLGRAPRRLLPLRPPRPPWSLHAGTSRTWPGTAHHTILFGRAWHETFREIITEGRADARSVIAGHPAHGYRPEARS